MEVIRKRKTNKDVNNLNNIINKLDFIDVYRSLHPISGKNWNKIEHIF